MNDDEREQWVMNDEPLYHQWRRYRGSMRSFLRENRSEIDATINARLN